MVFYRLRSSGETKLEITGITVQDDKVTITYETVDEQLGAVFSVSSSLFAVASRAVTCQCHAKEH